MNVPTTNNTLLFGKPAPTLPQYT